MGSLTIPWEPVVLAGISLTVTGWQLANIVPFTPLWSVEVPLASSSNQTTLRLVTANINFRNDRHEEILKMLKEQDADLILLLEVDQTWAKVLSPLDEIYPHRVGVVRGEGLGLVLWSRFPFRQQEVKHLVSERRASIFVTIDVPGMGPVRYIGVHPTPPGLKDRIEDNDLEEGRHDSRIRDAELVLVASEVREDPDQRWIVTGDFNDVAWSDTTRLFRELSDLKDPRIGRRLLNTYHAKWFLWRYPIDHVFVSDGLHLVSMTRVKAPGSDHFAIAATFAGANKDQTQPEVTSEQKEQGRELLQEGVENAKEREVKE